MKDICCRNRTSKREVRSVLSLSTERQENLSLKVRHKSELRWCMFLCIMERFVPIT